MSKLIKNSKRLTSQDWDDVQDLMDQALALVASYTTENHSDKSIRKAVAWIDNLAKKANKNAFKAKSEKLKKQ